MPFISNQCLNFNRTETLAVDTFSTILDRPNAFGGPRCNSPAFDASAGE